MGGWNGRPVWPPSAEPLAVVDRPIRDPRVIKIHQNPTPAGSPGWTSVGWGHFGLDPAHFGGKDKYGEAVGGLDIRTVGSVQIGWRIIDDDTGTKVLASGAEASAQSDRRRVTIDSSDASKLTDGDTGSWSLEAQTISGTPEATWMYTLALLWKDA